MTFQVERFASIAAELKPVIAEHWEEMPFDPDLPLNLDVDLYFRMDMLDRLHIVTARDEGRLVGYFAAFVGRHTHYDIQMAAMDVYFLLPEYRTAMNGMQLFAYFEETAQARGVRFLLATARIDRSPAAAKLFERLGWNAARTVYSKRLEA